MNIIIAIGNRSMGGAQRVALSLYKWIDKHDNVNISIISIAKSSTKEYDFSGIRYYQLENKHKIKQIINIIKKEKTDIFISMGVPMSIYTVPACKVIGIKHIISERNDPKNFSGKKLTRIISRFLMNFASGYVFQTKDAQKFYNNMIVKKSIIIPNPVFGIESMPKKIYSGERKKIIVSVGRLNKQKNFELLISTFKNVLKNNPDYKLLIWGEGPERPKLELLIKNFDLTNKILLPGNTDNLFEKIYDKALFVLSSDFEGMPNALMEAMALGLPCISTDCPCGGPRELIKNYENGILVPIKKQEELLAEINNVINSRELQNKLSKNAFKIRDNYNSDLICKRWYEYINSIK